MIFYPIFLYSHSSKYVYRSGNAGIKKNDYETHLSNYERYINRNHRDGWTHLAIEYLETNHLLYDQPETKLDSVVVDSMKLWLDKYMPLGIMPTSEFTRIEEILKDIDREINGERNEDRIKKLSDEYYLVVSWVGGVSSRLSINTHELLSARTEKFNRLRDAIIALHCGKKSTENPLDYFCREWLKMMFTPIHEMSEEFRIFRECIENTQHNDQFQIENILKIEYLNNVDFQSDLKDHCYLYHSTYINNLIGILKEGLVVAPNHVYSHNRYFGPGIYFSDAAAMVLKRFASSNFNCGIILVCRVALGTRQDAKMNNLTNGEYPWEDDANSLVYEGRQFAIAKNEHRILNEAKIFCGKLEKRTVSIYDHDIYNEYIVKNANQVRIDYIIKLKK